MYVPLKYSFSLSILFLFMWLDGHFLLKAGNKFPSWWSGWPLCHLELIACWGKKKKEKKIFFGLLICCLFIPLSTSSFLFHKTGQTEVPVCCRCHSIFYVLIIIFFSLFISVLQNNCCHRFQFGRVLACQFSHSFTYSWRSVPLP